MPRLIPADLRDTGALLEGQTSRLVPAVEVDGVFSAEECRRIIALQESLGVDEARVAAPDDGAGEGRQVVDTGVRATRRTHVQDGPATRWIFDRLGAAVEDVNGRTWQLRIALMEPMQLLGYPPGGHYVWHTDLGVRGIQALRKVSASVLLSDPSTYTGGDLQLRAGARLVQPAHGQGKAIFFPSWVPHRVTPVVRGTRHVLVLWTIGRRSLR